MLFLKDKAPTSEKATSAEEKATSAEEVVMPHQTESLDVVLPCGLPDVAYVCNVLIQLLQ